MVMSRNKTPFKVFFSILALVGLSAVAGFKTFPGLLAVINSRITCHTEVPFTSCQVVSQHTIQLSSSAESSVNLCRHLYCPQIPVILQTIFLLQT